MRPVPCIAVNPGGLFSWMSGSGCCIPRASLSFRHTKNVHGYHSVNKVKWIRIAEAADRRLTLWPHVTSSTSPGALKGPIIEPFGVKSGIW